MSVGAAFQKPSFDENNSSWADEFIELYNALSPDEYESARASTLTAFYTPPVVISSIYKAMEQMGFREGNILEPSCGIGNFIGMLPQSMQDSKIYGVEIDKISAGIAQQLYQKKLRLRHSRLKKPIFPTASLTLLLAMCHSVIFESTTGGITSITF